MSNILNYEELAIENEIFADIRNDFNLLLQKLFKKMQQSAASEGSVQLKVDIELIPEDIPIDGDGIEMRHIMRPVLKHKITSTVPVKENTSGTNDTGMELVYDDDLKRFVLRHVNSGGQTSMWDNMNGQDGEADADIQRNAVPLLEAGAFPMPTDGDEETGVDDGDGFYTPQD